MRISRGSLLLATLTLLAATGAQAGGHLRVATPLAGRLELRGIDDPGSSHMLELPAGRQMIWDLPSGVHIATFQPAGDRRADPGETEIEIAEGLTTLLAIATDPPRYAVRIPSSTRGWVTRVPAPVLAALPGSPEAVVAALDTHVRWRPDAAQDGWSRALAGERGERPAPVAAGAGQAWLALAPLGGRGGETGRCIARPPGPHPDPLGLALEVQGASPEAYAFAATTTFDASGLLRQPVRGAATLAYRDAANGRPAAVGDRTPPHNGRAQLDLDVGLTWGDPFPALLPPRAAQPPGATQAVAAAEAAPRESSCWGLAGRLLAQGSEREHYLEIYRYNLDHAPREEWAFLGGEVTGGFRLGASSRLTTRLRLTEGEHSLADGLHGGDIRAYYQPGGNPAADASGLYWQGSDDELLADAHVFDHYRWSRTHEASARIEVQHALDATSRLIAYGEGQLFTYRRFAHYSPTDVAPTEIAITASRALVLGYDPRAGAAGDEPFDPGRPFAARIGVTWETAGGGALRWALGAGARIFSARDSGFADPSQPLGGNARLDARDLAAPTWHATPEGRIGVAGSLGRAPSPSLDWWALGYRRSYLPPFEALYGPRPYFAQAAPEGVLGNPAIAPETESGLQLGLELPVPLAAVRPRFCLSGYAARLDDPLRLAYAKLDGRAGLIEDVVPYYENGGALRRWGVHSEATVQGAEQRWWARLAYDWSRIESNHLEPPLLDRGWLYPEHAAGEYESEGYSSPLGGLLDGYFAAGQPLTSDGYRPSHFDRPHCLSLALVTRLGGAGRGLDPRGGGWLLGTLVRYESGRPFSQSYVYPVALPPGSDGVERGVDDPAFERTVAEVERNAGRMPDNVTLDLAVSRVVRLGDRPLRLRIAAENLFDVENAIIVYRPTGEAETGGCAGDAACSNEYLRDVDPAAYAERTRLPAHYAHPLRIEASLGIVLD